MSEIMHHIRRYDGVWWCENEDVITELCTDYDRCNDGCVCNVHPEAQDCMSQGIHLSDCDEDGYCNYCGYPDNYEALMEEYGGR